MRRGGLIRRLDGNGSLLAGRTVVVVAVERDDRDGASR